MVKSEAGATEGIPPSEGRLQKLCGSRHDTVSLVLETQALSTLYVDSDDDEVRGSSSEVKVRVRPCDDLKTLLVPYPTAGMTCNTVPPDARANALASASSSKPTWTTVAVPNNEYRYVEG